jgi:hypothetical protein
MLPRITEGSVIPYHAPLGVDLTCIAIPTVT